jgi:hypothetical protein
LRFPFANILYSFVFGYIFQFLPGFNLKIVFRYNAVFVPLRIGFRTGLAESFLLVLFVLDYCGYVMTAGHEKQGDERRQEKEGGWREGLGRSGCAGEGGRGMRG